MDANYDGHTTNIEGTFTRLHSQLIDDVPRKDKRVLIDLTFLDRDDDGKRKRAAVMASPDEAFQFALGILRDVSLAKYGYG